MGLFEDRTDEEVKGGGSVESVNKGNLALQDLIREFKELRNSVKVESQAEGEEEILEEDEIGEEYEVSEEESASIENFLNDDGEEEEIEEDESFGEYYDDEEYYDEDDFELDINEDDFEEIEDEFIEEEIEEDPEPVDVRVNITELPEMDEDEQGYELPDDDSNAMQISANVVTSEEMDKKFEEFEKRLLDKIMKQFAGMQTSTMQQVTQTKNEEDDLEVKTVKGKLNINGYEFSGEVVMFTPLESLKPASWEEVVRRKGHCTYHLTTSGNGGWFIKKSNAPNPYAYIEKKEEAEELAKFYASREKAELKIHNAKGVIEKSLSFGREKLRG